jgi:predicted SAM-dependent methyltransferase
MIWRHDMDVLDLNEERLEAKRSELLNDRWNTSVLNRVRVRRIIGSFIRNRSFQLWSKDVSLKNYVNLGAGGNLLAGFVNIDYSWCPGLDLCWDISKGLPLKSDSVAGIFTEHTLEHFDWKTALKTFLSESFRILKPGGTIRISVPDADKAVAAYWEKRENGQTSKPWRKSYDGGERIPLTPMLMVNNTFRQLYAPLQSGHKCAYDFQTLEYFLHLSGFVNIAQEKYLQGREENLLVDYKKRAEESIYVEASKPRT